MKRGQTVTVSFSSASGEILEKLEPSIEDVLRLPSIPGGARWVEVQSPVHAPCRVAVASLAGDAICELRQLTQFWPFGSSGRGGVWFRPASKKNAPFVSSPSVPAQWGGGFALAAEPLDIVLHAEGDWARLFLSQNASALQPIAPGRPLPLPRMTGRFVVEPGRGPGEELAFQVVPSGRPDSPVYARAAAWKAFYQSLGLSSRKDGRFQIDAVAVDPLLWTVASTRFGRASFRTDGLRAGTHDLGELGLKRAVRIDARVVSSLAKLPSPLVLDVYSTSSERPEKSVNVDPRGAATVELDPGSWFFLLRSEKALGGRLVEVPEEAFLSVELPLDEVTVTGAVETSAGKAVSGARVSVQDQGRAPGVRSKSVSDERGDFALRFLHCDGPVSIVAEGDSGFDFSTGVDIDPRVDTKVTIHLPSRGFRFLVTDRRTGRPIPSAAIDLRIQTADGTYPGVPVDTDKAGVGRITGLPEGFYEIEAAARGYLKSKPVRRELRGAKTDVIADLDFALEPSRKLAGRVVNRAGDGVSARFAIVGSSLRAARHVTEADGGFDLELPDEGPHLGLFWSPGFRIQFVRLAIGEHARIVLDEPGTDSVVEIRDENAAPLAGRHIRMRAFGTELPLELVIEAFAESGCARPQTNSEGSVPLGRCLPDGPIELVLLGRSADGGYTELSAGIVTFPAAPAVRLTAKENKR